MSAFISKNAYWDFARTVQNERRFIFEGKAGEFLTAARETSKSRAHTLKSGTCLYRAQAGSRFAPENEMGIEEEHPLHKERMVPDPKFINRGGRANPRGFAYLYLARDEKTALAEMRPWVGESLTLANFEIQQDLNVVVCQAGSEDIFERLFEENSPAEKIDQWVWNDISKAFARPVNREEQELSYLPTQILAEVFKAEKFDGLTYQSGLERGMNVVLFNVRAAKLIHRFAYTLKKVRYDFEVISNNGIYRKKDGGGEYITEIHTESP